MTTASHAATRAGRHATVPAGYVELDHRLLPAGVRGVARADAARGVAAAVSEYGTLHGWAGRQDDRRAFHGRGVAWAVRLPQGQQVVVRHSRHGGILAPLTGDRFLSPTRAPRELQAALKLAAAGVPTPPVVAYLTYPAGLGVLRRADVATAEVEGGHDLPDALVRWPGERGMIVSAVATLVAAMTTAGARHPDLNVKNILLTPDSATGRGMTAHVLDVDRVLFHHPGDPAVARANLDRLIRSARRWRARKGPLLDEPELALVENMAQPEAG